MQNLGTGGTDSIGRMSYTLHSINEGSISDDSEANVSGTSGFSSGCGGGAKRSADDAGLDQEPESIGISSDDDPVDKPEPPKKTPPPNGKKTKGRVKIKMEFIDNKLRRYTTFSKRKTGIMKKAYELSTLTGTQVMLLVASETGHVYTFATRKLQPMITSEAGKALIQTCLNSPDPPMNHNQQLDQRMSATGFEETDLTYSIAEEDQKEAKPQTAFGGSSQAESSSSPSSSSQVNSSATLPVTTLLNSSVPTTKPNISMQLPTASYAAILASGVASAASAQQSSSSEATQNTVTMVPAAQQNLSLVSGNMVIPGPAVVATTANSLSGAVMYQTAQGVVYATPTSNLSEGVLLNFGQASTLQIPQDQGGNSTPQQYITIPVPVSLTAAPQIIQTQQGLSPSTSSNSSEPSSSPGVTDLSKSSTRK